MAIARELVGINKVKRTSVICGGEQGNTGKETMENLMRKKERIVVKAHIRLLNWLLKSRRGSITEFLFSNLVKTIQRTGQEKLFHWPLDKKKLPSLSSISYPCAQTSWKKAAESPNISY